MVMSTPADIAMTKTRISPLTSVARTWCWPEELSGCVLVALAFAALLGGCAAPGVDGPAASRQLALPSEAEIEAHALTMQPATAAGLIPAGLDREPPQAAHPVRAEPLVQPPPVPGLAAATDAVPQPPVHLWARLRAGFRLPALQGDAARRQAQHRAWLAAHPAYLERLAARARLYLHDITEVVEGAGLPLAIALLPAIESAFQPDVCSAAAACGLWQFIGATGRRFDLAQHRFIDQRRHVRAASQAAVRYLRELQRRYDGDWLLALAAYNCGEGCIDRAVLRARARGTAGRFEDLTLNHETAQYVPRLLALAQWLAQALDQGLALPALPNRAYFVAVPLTRDIDMALAARLAGISLADFSAINPQHRTPVMAAAASPWVYVPLAQEAAFVAALARWTAPLASWTTLQLARSSTLEALARQQGADAATLRAVTAVPPGRVVQAGSTLLVPRRQQDRRDIASEVAEGAQLVVQPLLRKRPGRRPGPTA